MLTSVCVQHQPDAPSIYSCLDSTHHSLTTPETTFRVERLNVCTYTYIYTYIYIYEESSWSTKLRLNWYCEFPGNYQKNRYTFPWVKSWLMYLYFHLVIIYSVYWCGSAVHLISLGVVSIFRECSLYNWKSMILSHLSHLKH